MLGNIIAIIAFVIVTVIMGACVVAGMATDDARPRPRHLCRA